jgi:uncharacterized protein YndB with AHSA1/START domain
MADNKQPANREDLVVKRIIDAPLEMVWKAWTVPQHVMRWWGPQYYTSPSCQIDLREGGKYVFAMQAPQEQGGQVHYSSGVYQKIVPMERLEFTQGLSDKDGNPVDPASIGMPPDFPQEMRVAIEFRAKGEFTELTITEYDWPVGDMYVYSLAGMHQSIDKLAESLAKPK